MAGCYENSGAKSIDNTSVNLCSLDGGHFPPSTGHRLIWCTSATANVLSCPTADSLLVLRRRLPCHLLLRPHPATDSLVSHRPRPRHRSTTWPTRSPHGAADKASPLSLVPNQRPSLRRVPRPRSHSPNPFCCHHGYSHKSSLI